MDKTENNLKSDAEMIPIELEVEEAGNLAAKLYGLTEIRIKELNSYDDKNYHISVSGGTTNPHIQELWPHGYVLKILNHIDSSNSSFVEAQNELMLYLGKHGISTTEPVKNLDGKYYSDFKLVSDEQLTNHIVRLLIYQPGILLKDVPPTKSLYHGIGRFAANLNLKMKGFKHAGFDTRKSSWNLYNVPNVKKHLNVLKDIAKESLVLEIVKEFEENVVAKFDTLQQGLIHGDFNEQNILVKKTESGHEISSILDFGDCEVSPYLFELAIIMCYLMLHSQSVEDGRDILSGYCSLFQLPNEELRLLKVCVAGRLVQSLVMGLYFHSRNPSNQYIIFTQKAGWQFLNKLWHTDADELNNLWFSGIEEG